jgi:hypothetical protein
MGFYGPHMVDRSEQIELDPVSETFELGEDRRLRIEQPPPVRIVSVDDCVLYAPAGLERQLDEFYVGLLRFVREDSPDPEAHQLIYRAENFRVWIEIFERPIPREDFRPLTLVVESLNELAHRLTESEIEFQRQRGLTPGKDVLLLTDPAGNPVCVGEYRVAI